MDREYVSPDGALRFRVRSSGSDVILGFAGEMVRPGFNGFAGHTHGEILAANSTRQTVKEFLSSHAPESAAEIIAKHVEQYVNDLLNSKLVIAISKEAGAIRDIWITYDPVADASSCPPDETIEFRLWDGRVIPVSIP